MRIPTTDLPSIIGNELNIQRKQANAVIKLLDDGATVPFIARYRKEATYGLDEVQVRNVQVRLNELREYLKRREFVRQQIADAGALTPELADRIEHTLDPTVLEDIYLPYRPKRNTRAKAAHEAGLEPLAKQLMAQNLSNPLQRAGQYVGEAYPTAEDALAGACDIAAEWMAENEKVRSLVRAKYQRSAVLSAKLKRGAEDPDGTYANYHSFEQPLRLVPSHRYLAVRRGEEEGILKVDISIDDNEMTERLCRFFVKQDAPDKAREIIAATVKDSYRRLLRTSIENEIAAAAKEKADTSAIALFAENLRQKLMAPPLFGQRIMGIDPGYKSGCKVACLDRQGQLMAHDIFYLNDPHGATYTVCSLVDRYAIDVIAVGTGTAGRETEKFLNTLRFPRRVQIVPVSEDGASVYSASDVARQEFPDLDLTVRGAVSIGRRLLDPLAELVKIEPQSIGVGQYQHDVNQTKLRQSLDATVESCVNSVGVNVNTASAPLLSYVSGIGQALAGYIVDYRNANGPFKSRQDLTNVPRMGERTFQQCAGFLRIDGAANPLDNTAIHPERYALVEQMARDLRTNTTALCQNPQLADKIEIAAYLEKDTCEDTLRMIVSELKKPGRDPRGSGEIEIMEPTITSIQSIVPGMEVTGKVNNITAFGVFVDLGIKENGLIHISQLSERFVSNPLEIVSIDQTVKARVIDVDPMRGRIALTLKGMAQSDERQ